MTILEDRLQQVTELRPHERRRLLTHAVVVNFLFGGVGWYYIIMLVSEVRADLDIGIGEWGLLWSGISLGVLLSSIPGGALGDRFGVRRLVASGLVVSGSALLLRATAGQFLTMLLTMILFGVGLGVASTNVPKALGTWFPANKLGLANGLALAGLGAGQACAALLTVPVAGRLGGWRLLTLILGAVLIGAAVYWWLAVRETAPRFPRGDAPRQPRPAVARVLRIRQIWILGSCYALFLGGLLGAIGYLPTYLTSVRGLSPQSAGIVISLAPWTFVIGSALLPALSDRVKMRGVVYGTGIIGSALFVLGHVYFGGFALAMVSALFGLSAGAVGILFVVPVEMNRVGPALAGTAIGVIVSAGFLGGSVLPALGMSLAESRPVTGMVFFSTSFVLSAFAFLLIRESGPAREPT
jgi:NNP family nitrate/nitrite transporter-like MFS transporter